MEKNNTILFLRSFSYIYMNIITYKRDYIEHTYVYLTNYEQIKMDSNINKTKSEIQNK